MTEPEQQRPPPPPAPGDLPSEEHRLPAVWAAMPVLSLGMLSWGPFLYAALRTHARKFQIATAIYLSLAIVAGVLVAVSNHGHSTLNDLGGLLLITSAAAGCVHTLAIRGDYGRQLKLADDPTLLVAEQRAELRARALRLIRNNPRRALELGVGRPDVPGSFDAGLVDVNHARADALATLPGLNLELAQRIVELRTGGSGFESLDDLDLLLDLAPGTLHDLGDRVVFIPRN